MVKTCLEGSVGSLFGPWDRFQRFTFGSYSKICLDSCWEVWEVRKTHEEEECIKSVYVTLYVHIDIHLGR